MDKVRKRDVFAMLDRNHVNPTEREMIKAYIDRLIRGYWGGKKKEAK